MARVLVHVRRAIDDITGAARLAADTRSLFRLLGDFALYRIMRFVTVPGLNRERRVRLRDGVVITYRLNRGDIWALHQMWVEEVCRLPIDCHPKIIVDLGA